MISNLISTIRQMFPMTLEQSQGSLSRGGRRRLRRRTQVHSEFLEQRVLLAVSHTVSFDLDFTPDKVGPKEDKIPGDFSEIFSLDYWTTEFEAHPITITNGSSTQTIAWADNERVLKQLLDFNGDNEINQLDINGDPSASKKRLGAVDGAMNAIRDGVRGKFNSIVKKLSESVKVEFNVVDDGWNRLVQSKTDSATDTYVMFVGNKHPRPPQPQRFAVSVQADPGFNLEYYGYVFAGDIVRKLVTVAHQSKQQRWTPNHFSNFVVNAASHEFGHQLGLGHVYQRVEENGDLGFEISTDTKSLMSYGATPWSNNATFRDKTYNFVEQDEIGPQNPWREIFNSLSRIGQETQSLAESNEAPLLFSGHLEDFGFSSPSRDLPLPTTGLVGSTTAANITASFTSGLNAVRNTLVSEISSQLNLPSSTLPLVSKRLTTMFGLETRLQAAIAPVDLAGVSTLSALTDKLIAAGYTIDEARTDAELANLRLSSPASPADFVRASQTFRLLDLLGTSGLNKSVLSALSDLSGMNISGTFEAIGNMAVHLTIGVDTGGFYIAPGLILDAPIQFSGGLSATLGTFGRMEGEGSVDLRASIQLSSESADHRIRLSNIAASVSAVQLEGVAGTDLSFAVNAGGRNLDFGGNWLWSIESGTVALDTDSSGFDENRLLDSLADLTGDGVDGFFSASNDLGNVAREIPVIGKSLSSKVTDSLAGLVDLDSREQPFADRLRDAGFTLTIGAGITPRSFIDGSYATVSNLFEVTYNKTYTPQIETYAFTGSIDVGAGVQGNVSGNLSLNGNPASAADDSRITLSLGFGLDIASGPYLKEGSFVEFLAAPKVIMNGQLDVGKLTSLNATVVANIGITSRVTLDDNKASTNKFFLSSADSELVKFLVQSGNNLKVQGDANFALSLRARNPVSNLAFLGIGSAIKEALASPTNPTGAFEWTASAGIQFVPTPGGFETTSTFHITSTEDYLKNIAEKIKEAIFRRTFLGEIEKYNPFPSDFRKLLKSKMALLDNRSLADLTGLNSLEILLADSPQSDVGSSNEVDAGLKGGAIDVKFDILEFQQISNLLSGKDANLVSLVVDKSFTLTEVNIPIVSETLLASYFGILNVTGQLDLTGDVGIDVDLVAALDTKGFYIQEKPNIVSLTGSLGVSPTLRARLTAAEFARIEGQMSFELTGGIGFTGGVEGKIRDQILPSIYTIGADLVLSLDGMVGFPEAGLSSQFDLYDQRLKLFDATYHSEALSTDSNGFPDARSRMKKELDNLGLCAAGIATSTLIPGVGAGAAAIACGAAYSQQITQAWRDAVDWAGDRWNDLSSSAAEAERKVRNWAEDRRQAIDNASVSFDKNQLEPIRKKLESIPLLGPALSSLGRSIVEIRDDFYNAVNFETEQYKTHDEIVDNVKQSFSATLSDRVLTIEYAGDALKGRYANVPNSLDIAVSTIGEQYLVIQGGRADSNGNFVEQTFSGSEVVKVEIEEKRTWDKREWSWNAWEVDSVREVRDSNFVHKNVAAFDLTSVSRIIVRGTSLNDSVIFSRNILIPVHIDGMEGNDILSGGSSADVIVGGIGDDRIDGGNDSDQIDGGTGHDRITGGLGSDVILGGAGNDTIDESTPAGLRTSEQNTIAGGTGNDTIQGSPGEDSIRGEAGEDQISGGGGNDLIEGGDGADRIDGELGNDHIQGGAGGDILRGGDGNDQISGSLGADLIEGGEGADILSGEDESDQISGGGGNDEISGGLGADLLYGGAGNDHLFGAARVTINLAGDGNDVIYGEGGNDTIFPGAGGMGLPNLPSGGQDRNYVDAGDGNDVVVGGSGPDYILAGIGDDKISGNDGDDVVVGQEGSDQIDAGGGNDMVLASTNPTSFLGSTINGGTGDDVIVGSSGRDVLIGGPGKDELHGGFKDDLMRGEGDNDKLVGDDGNDSLEGGEGNDRVAGDSGDDRYVLNTSSQIGSDTLSDKSGVDTLDFSLSSGNVTVDLGLTTAQTVNTNFTLLLLSPVFENAATGQGNDSLTGNSLNNFLSGGEGNDTYKFDPAKSGDVDMVTEYPNQGLDLLDFGTLATPVVLNLGSDAVQSVHVNRSLKLNSAITFETIIGGSNNDILTGNTLNNVLNGANGNDILNGASGNDTLDGGTGSDTYMFSPAASAEKDVVIESFDQGTDRLHFGTLATPIALNLGSVAVQSVHANRTLKLSSAKAFENIIGGSNNDILTGNTLNNVLNGANGNDILNGASGNDTLDGGAGSDTYAFNPAVGSEADVIVERISTLESFDLVLPEDVLDFSTLPAGTGVDIDLSVGKGIFATHQGRVVRSVSDSPRVEIERVLGGAGDDQIKSRSSWWHPISLYGNAGDDNFLLSWDFGGELLTAAGGTGSDSVQLTGSNVWDYDFSGVETIDVSRLTSGYFGAADGAVNSRLETVPGMILKREAGTTVPLASGWTTSRAIGTPGDTDSYSFMLDQATRLYFDNRIPSGDIQWQLIGPGGIVRDWMGINSEWITDLYAPVDLGFLPAGNYELTLRAVYDRTGAYDFRLLDSSAASTQVALNTPVNVNLNPASSAKIYSFAATAGTVVYLDQISYSATGSFFPEWNAQWTLKGPYGTDLGRGFLSADIDRILLPSSGIYSLIIDGSAEAAGLTKATFVVRRVVDNSAALVLNSAITASISDAGQIDSYTFSLASPTRLLFQQLSHFDGLEWHLQVASGTIRSVPWNEAGGQNFGLLPAGDYKLLASGVGGTRGNYAFSLKDLGLPAVNSPSSVPGTVMALGTAVAGSITTDIRERSYKFTLASPSRLWFDTRTNNPSIQWQLTGPAGTVRDWAAIGFADFGIDDQQLGLLPAGTYSLKIRGEGDFTGSYSFAMLNLENPTNVALNTPVNVTLNPASSAKVYSFTGTAGSVVYLDQTSFSPNTDDDVFDDWSASWTLMDSYGTVLSQRYLSEDGGRITLPSTGTYSLIVYGAVSATGLTKATLVVRSAVDDSVTLGLNSAVNGTISGVGQIDSYNFTLTSPSRLWFDTRTTNPSIQWQLTGPEGIVRDWAALGSPDFGIDDQYLGLLPAGGYSLKIRGYGDVTGAYSFALLNLASSTNVTLNTPVNVTLNPANSAKVYSFTGTAGSVVYLDQTSYLPNTDDDIFDDWSASWTLMNSYGMVLSQRYLSEDGGRITLPTTGTYSLIVYGAVAATGITKATFVVRSIVDDSVVLSLNSAINGTISGAGQIDSYSFTLTSPGRLWFDTRTNNPSIQWQLTGPQGIVRDWAAISFADFGIDDQQLGLLPAGTYSLKIRGYGDVTGEYSFAMLNLESSTSVALNTPVNVTLNPATSAKAYSFTATAGSVVYLDQTSYLPAEDNPGNASWTLMDSYGTVLSQQYLNADGGRITLPTTGTYSLTVYGLVAATGLTNATFVVRSVVDDSVTLGLNSAVNGTISGAGQIEFYKFTLTSPRRIVLDSRTESETLQWRLETPSRLIQDWTRFTAGEVNFGLLPAGDYKLLASGIGEALGSYAFSLKDLGLPAVNNSSSVPGTAVALGTAVAGSITTAAQERSYKFTLTSPSRLWFDTRTNNLSIQWLLTGPEGIVRDWAAIGSPDYGIDDQHLGLLPAGTYSLKVRGDGDAIGAYSFTMLNLASSTNLTFNTPVNVTLNPANSAKVYSFTGTAGSAVYLDQTSYLPAEDNPGNASWTLMDSYGTVLSQQYLNADGGRITLPTTGKYWLVVHGAVAATGLTKATLVVRSVVDDSKALALNSAINGTISGAGQIDSFSFTLTSPGRLWFDTRTNNPSIQWQLTGPAGLVLDWAAIGFPDFGEDQYVGLLPAGTYSLKIRGYGDVTGGYSFAMLNLARATSVALNTPVNVTLNPANSAKVYSFTGTAGSVVYLDQTSFSPNADDDIRDEWSASWTLMDSYGVVLSQQYLSVDGGRILLPTTGNYSLVVHGALAATDLTKATFVVWAIDAQDSPVVLDFGADLAYSAGASPLTIAPNVSIADRDSNRMPGTMTIRIKDNPHVMDRITILPQGVAEVWQVSTTLLNATTGLGLVYLMVPEGNELKRLALGSFSGGIGSTPLTILFNENATPERVQFVARAIAFQSLSPVPPVLTRTIEFLLTDGQGGVSRVSTKQILGS